MVLLCNQMDPGFLGEFSVEFNQLAVRLAVAAIGGLAVGIEREWAHKAKG